MSISLSRGDLMVTMPQAVLDDAWARISRTAHGYGDALGLVSLREVIRTALPSSDLDVAITGGASTAITAAILAASKPGDGTLVPEICYPGTFETVRLLGRRPIRYRIAGSQLVPLSEGASEATIVILVTPDNPTGRVESQGAVEAVLNYCMRTGAVLISDEVYSELIYDGRLNSPLDAPGKVPVFRVQSASKSMGLCGYRSGSLVAPKGWMKSLERVLLSMNICPPMPGQILADEMRRWSGFSEWQGELVQWLRRRRDLCVPRLRAAGFMVESPAAGPFLWLDTSGLGVDAETLCDLLRGRGVLLAPGTLFSPSHRNHVRLCFSSCDDTDLECALRVVEAMAKAITSGGVTWTLLGEPLRLE